MPASRNDELRARFTAAVRGAGGPGAADPVFDELVLRYGEPHRHYHTLRHVDACLGWLDWFAASAEHGAEVELSLWFHDAVYDPRAADNERKSAGIASERLRALGCDAESVARIVHHVEATERHDAYHGDAALVMDLDLSILGASPNEFQRFEEAIAREYDYVAEAAFRDGRRRVLEGFLARPEIFRIPEIRAELEHKARKNLEKRIRELSLTAG